MTNTNITTSKGINLTIDDLKQAINLTDVDWVEAAFANQKANSKDPIDICIFDFFNKDAWETVDEDFAEEYAIDEVNSIALACLIKKRSFVWANWAEEIRLHEEGLYILTGKPFSLAYSKLFIEDDDDFLEGCNPALVQADKLNDYTIVHNEQEKRDEYRCEFVWGEVKYLVTKFYSHERIKQGNTENQPDFYTIKVEKADD